MTHTVHVGSRNPEPQTLRTPFSTPSKTPYPRPLSETTEIYETDLEDDDESLFEENSPKPSFGSVSNILLLRKTLDIDFVPVRQQEKE